MREELTKWEVMIREDMQRDNSRKDKGGERRM